MAEYDNLSEAHKEARREMRRLLLALDVPNADRIISHYYTTITLAEHEAARVAHGKALDPNFEDHR